MRKHANQKDSKQHPETDSQDMHTRKRGTFVHHIVTKSVLDDAKIDANASKKGDCIEEKWEERSQAEGGIRDCGYDEGGDVESY